MMNKIIRTTLITLLLTFAAHAAAQQGLQIATVFQKYGKQKGVTMVELSNEMLETYQMTLYKVLFQGCQRCTTYDSPLPGSRQEESKEGERSGFQRANQVRLLPTSPA